MQVHINTERKDSRLLSTNLGLEYERRVLNNNWGILDNI